ncbi:MAG: hypothetical protein ACO1OD_14295 [Croceibacterium sp.]
MSAVNGWLASSLVVFTVALVAYFASDGGFAWTSFAYPLPVSRKNFDEIYLADFAYLGFLAVTAYWILWAWLGKIFPTPRNLPGILLGLSALLFVAVSADFLANFIPQTSRCRADTLANGIIVTACDYSHDPRMWVALLAGVSLVVSLLVATFARADAQEAQQDS